MLSHIKKPEIFGCQIKCQRRKSLFVKDFVLDLLPGAADICINEAVSTSGCNLTLSLSPEPCTSNGSAWPHTLKLI